MITLHDSTCLLTYYFQLTVSCLFIYSLSMLSFACSLTHLNCQHSLAHSCFHTLSLSLVSSLAHLTFSYLYIPLEAFSFSHLLTPSKSFSLAYSLIPHIHSHLLTHLFHQPEPPMLPSHSITITLISPPTQSFEVIDLFLKCILTCSMKQFFELTFTAHPFISSNPPSLK